MLLVVVITILYLKPNQKFWYKMIEGTINMKGAKKQIVQIKQMPTKRTPSLNLYFNDVNKYRIMSASEEIETIRAYKNGDESAGTKLIYSNLRFVISVAKQYSMVDVPLSDLISAGNIGLLKAVERFDESRGFKFISYAVWWIRQAVLHEISENSRMIKLPYNVHSANVKHRRKYGEDLPQISDLRVSSYNRKTADDEMEMLELIPDNDVTSPDDIFSTDTILHRMIERLHPREREIVKMKYGIGYDKEHTYDEICSILNLGLTKERIRQIHFAALRKLKYYSRSVNKNQELLGG